MLQELETGILIQIELPFRQTEKWTGNVINGNVGTYLCASRYVFKSNRAKNHLNHNKTKKSSRNHNCKNRYFSKFFFIVDGRIWICTNYYRAGSGSGWPEKLRYYLVPMDPDTEHWSSPYFLACIGRKLGTVPIKCI